MKKSVYEIIKKQNGEAFAQGIRRFDSSIFDIPNLPEIVRHAGKDVRELLPYLTSLKPQLTKTDDDFQEAQDLFELAQQAGYKVIYADTLEKQNSIRSLFQKSEELCTFNDPTRFKNYHILHLIKEGAEKLNRFDFMGKEVRDDAYGTSVISIQVLKQGGSLKICNRYNHTVSNPDNTFDGNPDNIIKGLTLSIEKFLNQKVGVCAAPLPEGFLQLGHKIYQYHLEADNIYYSTDYYIHNHKPVFINKDYQMIMDCFIIDFKKKEIKSPGMEKSMCFLGSTYSHVPLIQNEVELGQRLTRSKEGNVTTVCLDGAPILKSRNGVMTYLNLKNTKNLFENQDVACMSGLFQYHDGIEEIYLDDLTELDASLESCFFGCPNLKVLSLPNLEFLESNSILHLPMLQELNLNSLCEVGFGCLNYLGRLTTLELPSCQVLRSFTLSKNNMLMTLKLPMVERIDKQSIVDNPILQEIECKKLKQVSSQAIQNNPRLVKRQTVLRINRLKKATDLMLMKKGGRCRD